MQSPTLGHPASKHSTRTFRHLGPALTTGSRSDSRAPLQDGGSCLGIPWSPLSSLCPQTISGHPSGHDLLFSLVHSRMGLAPGDSFQSAPGGKSSLRVRALPATCSARAQCPPPEPPGAWVCSGP